MIEVGLWVYPYTGTTFRLASNIEIDHIFPLCHAHNTGGASWSSEKKRRFANDPKNLIFVEDNINRSKGDSAPDEWMPPNKAFWHEYASRWIEIKKAYGLTISPAEPKALAKMLDTPSE